MYKKVLKVAFVVAIAMVAGINVFNSQKPEVLSDVSLSLVEALAQSESVAGGVKCLGENDIECIGKTLSGICHVQITNNSAIVSCDDVYGKLGDCCGIKNVVKW